MDGDTKDAVLRTVVDKAEADSDEETTLVAMDESLTLVDAELVTIGDAIGMAVGDTEADVDWIDDAPRLDVTGCAIEDVELAVHWIEDIAELDVTGWAVDIAKPEVSWRDDAEAVWVVDGETKDAVLPIVMDTSEVDSDEEATLVAADESSTLVDAELAIVGDSIERVVEEDIDWIDDAA